MTQDSDEALNRAMTWVGKTMVSEDVLGAKPAQMLYETLGLEGEMPESLILPWHWLYHLESVRPENVGGDGHPRLGLFMPPLLAKRRMFVGSTMRMMRDVEFGAEVTREKKILSIDEKHGRVGTFYLVRVMSELRDSESVFLQETQTIAYLDSWGAARASDAKPDDKPPVQFEAALIPDAPMLFRFSALTFNGHRIHYDSDYAGKTEQYPGIVIHGPLSALMLAWYGRQWLGKPLRQFGFRTHAPLFLGEAMRFEGAVTDDDNIELWVRAPDGQLAVSAAGSVSG